MPELTDDEIDALDERDEREDAQRASRGGYTDIHAHAMAIVLGRMRMSMKAYLALRRGMRQAIEVEITAQIIRLHDDESREGTPLWAQRAARESPALNRAELERRAARYTKVWTPRADEVELDPYSDPFRAGELEHQRAAQAQESAA